MNQINRLNSARTYHGVVVPMITPCTALGELDEAAVKRVIDHLVEGGVHGIFVLGTTGEGDSMSLEMRRQLVATTVDTVNGRAQVYVGISDNALDHSLDVAGLCAALGVDAVVAHLPSYFPLSAHEQRVYYLELAERIDLPLILYNIPSTTHMSIPVEVVMELRAHPKIVALKDSENNPARLERLLRELGERDDFSVLVGVAALSAWALGLGADGIVPSSGNLVPELCRSLYDLSLAGDEAGAKRRQHQIDEAAELYRGTVSVSQSLGRLKAAMGALDLCESHVLPPLLPPPTDEQAAIQQRYQRMIRTEAID
jgi:dihydrodipicolinate synthase/N-acetylneuraminate lyase